MSASALDAFLEEQVAKAKADGVLFSAHLKATMMKVSDPIIFGHVVRAYFADVFAQYGEQLAAAGLSANDGLGGILAGLDTVEGGAEIKAAFETGPRRRARRWRWSTPTRASPTCTCPPTSSSTPPCRR